MSSCTLMSGCNTLRWNSSSLFGGSLISGENKLPISPSSTSKFKPRRSLRACAASPEPLLVKAAKGLPVSRPPAWMMRQAGRYMAIYRKLAEKHPSFRERSETTDLIVEISLQPWEAFRPDGVIIFSDILTPLPAFGVPFDIEEVRGPVIQSPIRTEDDLKALHPIELDKLDFVGESLKLLRKEVDGKAALLGFVGAPWTIATYIVEGGTTRTYTVIKRMCHTAPHVLRKLLSHLTEAIAEYVVFQVKSGAHCIQIFDSWGGQLPPHMWELWSKPYIKQIVATVRARCPGTPLVLYINGNGGLLERMKDVGVDVIGLDWTVDMADGRKRLGGGISVQGNVDPAFLFSPLPALTDEIKRCSKDVQLEKALHEMRAEYAEIKFTADSRIAEANALAINIEEKSLEVEAKLREADAKHAEASRKSSDIERKKQDLDVRESSLKRARLSLDSEREAHESTLSKQKEDLREWEKKIQEGEERLYESQRILNQREERVNEVERRCKQKENDLEAAKKKIDIGNKELKKTEEEIISKLQSLKEKEQEVDTIRKRIEQKETELRTWEEKLSDREKTELQKLLDDHEAELDAKKKDFELELNEKRKSIEEELRSKTVAVEKREAEINHKEDKIGKREEALEKKLVKMKQREIDLDRKSKAVKDEEKSIKTEEKRLGIERKQVLSDKENSCSLKAELEQKEADLEKQLQEVLEEKEQLKITEEERLDYTRLQSDLKQEIEKCRQQKEELMRESQALKQERESFEREWEVLDEKKAETEKELNKINEEKEKLGKWRQAEEERLSNDTLAARTNIEREMEALRLAKESFAAEMEHEKCVLSQKAKSDRSETLNDIELRKRELEIEMQMKREEMQKSLAEKERSFEDEREKELVNITNLREETEREMELMKVEKHRIEKQKEEVETNRRDLEEQRIQIQKDIDQLVILIGKLKNQREHFLNERERFISFVKKHEGCQKCGELTHEFVISDLHSLHDIEGGEIVPLPSLAGNYMRSGDVADAETPKSAGKVSALLRKCASKIFLFSPTKNNEKIAMQNMQGEAVNDSIGIRRESGDDSIREEAEGHQETSMREESNINNENQEAETSQLSGLNIRSKPAKKKGASRVLRTRTMKAVVKEAEAILGHDVEQDSEHQNEAEDLSLTGTENVRTGRKRSRAQTSGTTPSLQDGDDGEENSDSITAGRRGKRRQKAVQAPVANKYNLRTPRKEVKAPTIAPCSQKRRPKANRTESVDMAVSGNGGSISLMQEEAEEETSGAPNETNQVATSLVRRLVMVEEMNETSDRHEAYSDDVTPQGNNVEDSVREVADADDDDEDEETLLPGEASIGKKLWNFLTT